KRATSSPLMPEHCVLEELQSAWPMLDSFLRRWRRRLLFPGNQAVIAALPKSIKKEKSRQREQNEAHEQAVDRGDSAIHDCPDNSQQREKAKDNGKHEHHGLHATSFSKLFL